MGKKAKGKSWYVLISAMVMLEHQIKSAFKASRRITQLRRKEDKYKAQGNISADHEGEGKYFLYTIA